MTTQDFSYKMFKFSSSVLTLQAIKTWKTSHSSSNHRNNFLVTIEYNGITGKGQAGLPPKKQKCYLADVNDCFSFIKSLQKKLQTEQIIIDNTILDIQNYFLLFKSDQVNKNQFYRLLSAIHSFQEPQFRAAISAVEFGLFDLWSKILNKPLLECIYGQLNNLNFRSFVSVSISETQVQDARQSTKLTPLIKLKFSDDFESISNTLTNLIDENIGQLIVLDANASWSPETTKKVINFIGQNKYHNRIYCLEQPYPVQPDVKQWKEVFELAKQQNVSIMADETFTNADNIQVVKQISNGVNIKTQKTGGLIKAIKSALKSKQSNLYVWLGIMVSSWLGCTQTYMLAPLASFGDIDGGFIMKSPFQAGFIFKSNGYLQQIKCVGLGVEKYIQNS